MPPKSLMLRFAILIHDHPHLHWDLLVEQTPEDPLRTWRLEQPPEHEKRIQAEALPDHRRLYLDYEGPLSGNRGEVKRWDAGQVEILSQTAAEIILQFAGQRLRGTAVLSHLAENAWTFQYSASEQNCGEPSKS